MITDITQYTPAAYFKKELIRRQGKDRDLINKFPKSLISSIATRVLSVNDRDKENQEYYYEEIINDLKARNFYIRLEEIPIINSLVTGNPLIKLAPNDEEKIMTYFHKFWDIYSKDYPKALGFPLGNCFLLDNIANFLGIRITKGCFEYANESHDKNSIDLINELDQYLKKIWLKDLEPYAIILQSFWRKVRSQRIRDRLRIKNELEYLPNIGIKYYDSLSNWDNHKKINKIKFY